MNTTEQAHALAQTLHHASQLYHEGRYDAVIPLCEKSLSLHPEHWPTLSLLGHTYRQLQKRDHALNAFKASLLIQPKQAHALIALGELLDERRRYKQSIACYTEALNIDPDALPALLNLVAAYLEEGDLTMSQTWALKGLSQQPHHLGLLNNLIVIALEQGDLEAAEHQLTQAFALKPDGEDRVNLLVNHARLLSMQLKHECAIEQLEKAYAMMPNHPSARYALSMRLLYKQRFSEGWRLYDARFQQHTGLPYIRSPWRTDDLLPQPSLQSPQSLHTVERPILAIHEQGIGDELFFLRFAVPLTSFGYTLEYLSSKTLHPLLEQSAVLPQRIKLINPNHRPLPPQQERLALAVGDLPHLLLTCDKHNTLPTLPKPLPLTPPPYATEKIRSLLNRYPRPWIGITFEAGVLNKMGTPEKSVNIEAAMKVLLQKTGGNQGEEHQDRAPGSLFILQRTVSSALLNRVQTEYGRYYEKNGEYGAYAIDASAYYTQPVELLALLNELDHYMGVSNANMHFYAGLGKQATLFLTKPYDFRWSTDHKGASLWFPNFDLLSI